LCMISKVQMHWRVQTCCMILCSDKVCGPINRANNVVWDMGLGKVEENKTFITLNYLTISTMGMNHIYNNFFLKVCSVENWSQQIWTQIIPFPHLERRVALCMELRQGSMSLKHSQRCFQPSLMQPFSPDWCCKIRGSGTLA
jgi:hypothetical protein